MQCPYCGTTVNESDIFCPNCGADVIAKPEPEEKTTYSSSTQNSTQNNYNPKYKQTVMVEDKVLGGSVDKKTFFGLIWLAFCTSCFAFIAFVLNIVVLIIDKDRLTTEEKRCAAAMFVMQIVTAVLLCIPYLGWLALIFVGIYHFICSLIAALMAFQGKLFRIPIAYHIAAIFIK